MMGTGGRHSFLPLTPIIASSGLPYLSRMLQWGFCLLRGSLAVAPVLSVEADLLELPSGGPIFKRSLTVEPIRRIFVVFVMFASRIVDSSLRIP